MVVPARTKAFNAEFMKQFEEQHAVECSGESKPAVGGWPDNGDGRYSDKLSYRAWFEFNNAQRVH